MLECPIANKQNIILRVKKAPTGTKRYVQENLTPSMYATVETLVYHILATFSGEELNICL